MIRFIFLAFFIFNGFYSSAQSEVKNLDVKIMPTHLESQIPYAMRSKIERKVINIFTASDVVNSKGSTFAVYPSLSIIEFDKMEGIKTLQTVQMEFSLRVKNVFSNEDLTIFSKNISGAGNTQKAAITKAVSSIRPSKSVYKKFVKGLLEKMDSYYSSECETIIADAKKAMKKNEYAKAIALLNALPKSSDCRNTNENLLDQAYQSYQKQNCNRLIQKANIASLKKDYKNAITLLGQVDVESPCGNDAKMALQKIGSANDEQTAKKLAFLNKVYSDNKEIQKARQQSMNAISNTYIEGINRK